MTSSPLLQRARYAVACVSLARTDNHKASPAGSIIVYMIPAAKRPTGGCDPGQAGVQSAHDGLSLRAGSLRGRGVRPPRGGDTRRRPGPRGAHRGRPGDGRDPLRQSRLPQQLPRIPGTCYRPARRLHAGGMQDLHTRKHHIALQPVSTRPFGRLSACQLSRAQALADNAESEGLEGPKRAETLFLPGITFLFWWLFCGVDPLEGASDQGREEEAEDAGDESGEQRESEAEDEAGAGAFPLAAPQEQGATEQGAGDEPGDESDAHVDDGERGQISLAALAALQDQEHERLGEERLDEHEAQAVGHHYP